MYTLKIVVFLSSVFNKISGMGVHDAPTGLSFNIFFIIED